MSESTPVDRLRHARRQAIRRHPTQRGLDFAVTRPDPDVEHSWTVELVFIDAIDGAVRSGQKRTVPDTLAPAQVQLTTVSGDPAVELSLIQIEPLTKGATGVTLRIRRMMRTGDGVEQPEQSSGGRYRLQLIGVAGLDPWFSSVTLDLTTGPPIAAPIITNPSTPVAGSVVPGIDYLAKDYSSFRQLMLNRMTTLLPAWEETSPADLGVTLVELLAGAADQVSYYQDAVAAEAYLETARRRISVRRHVKLVDYALHEGCNARGWVQILAAPGPVLASDANTDAAITIPRGTRCVTQVPGFDPVLGADALESVLESGAEVFETVHDLEARPLHDAIPFYVWGADQFSLPTGATQATLAGRFDRLVQGDILIFEEVCGTESGLTADARTERRHPVRLTSVSLGWDPLGGLLEQFGDVTTGDASELVDTGETSITVIEWASEDALPFELTIQSRVQGGRSVPTAVARGNIVLVDHGLTLGSARIEPNVVSPGVPYRPRLAHPDLTFAEPVEVATLKASPASRALDQAPHRAVPQIWLNDGVNTWSPRPDLLVSDRFSTEYVVEVEQDRMATLRFGDGWNGYMPSVGTRFSARARIGNGPKGNVAADAIGHILFASLEIRGVRNPLATRGGTAPESVAHARRFAPILFRQNKRCVVPEDYVQRVSKHPEVSRAAAALEWTGTWRTLFLAIDRTEGRPIDQRFRRSLLEWLEPYRTAGQALEIAAPQPISLDIALTVTVASVRDRDRVRAQVLERLGRGSLPNGEPALFHVRRRSFGEPIFLSDVHREVLQVDGAVGVTVRRFQRWSRPANGELEDGQITCGPLEILRLENLDQAPERGRLDLTVEVGS